MKAENEIKNVVINIMNLFDLEFDETHKKVFINHMLSFYQRIKLQQDVGLEVDDNMMSQVSNKIWKQSEQLIKSLFNELNEPIESEIPKAEIFLIATHLLLC